MELTLTPEMEANIQRHLERGGYGSSEEVMSRALSALDLCELVPVGDEELAIEIERRCTSPENDVLIDGERFEADVDEWMQLRMKRAG